MYRNFKEDFNGQLRRENTKSRSGRRSKRGPANRPLIISDGILKRPGIAVAEDCPTRMQIKTTFSYGSGGITSPRKPRLMRRPRGVIANTAANQNEQTDERTYDNNKRSLYTISASSLHRPSSTTTRGTSAGLGCTSSGAGSHVFNANMDTDSKPTNYATIASNNSKLSYNLPKLPLVNNGSYKSSNNIKSHSAGINRNKKSHKNRHELPNPDTNVNASRNWINAELKVFPLWHDLHKTKTDVHNRMPLQSTIYLEKLVEEQRSLKSSKPDQINFSDFAQYVKSANSSQYREHVLGRSTFSPIPGPKDCYRHGMREQYSFSADHADPDRLVQW